MIVEEVRGDGNAYAEHCTADDVVVVVVKVPVIQISTMLTVIKVSRALPQTPAYLVREMAIKPAPNIGASETRSCQKCPA